MKNDSRCVIAVWSVVPTNNQETNGLPAYFENNFWSVSAVVYMLRNVIRVTLWALFQYKDRFTKYTCIGNSMIKIRRSHHANILV